MSDNENRILILKNRSYILQQFMQNELMVRAMREVKADPTLSYDMKLKSGSPVVVKMIAKSAFDSLTAAVDPAESLVPFISNVDVEVVAASRRAQEIYHLVAGIDVYSPDEDRSPYLQDKSGFRYRFLREGQNVQIENEVLTTQDSGVTVSFPISDVDSVSASSVGNPALDVTVSDASTGAVDLADSGSPIADGTEISISYVTQGYVVYRMVEPNGDIPVVFASSALIDLLNGLA